MGERLLEPTASKMATISSDKAASATAREQIPPSSQPQKLIRAHTADEGGKWFGAKPPEGAEISTSLLGSLCIDMIPSHRAGRGHRGLWKPPQIMAQAEFDLNHRGEKCRHLQRAPACRGPLRSLTRNT
jgi:hypothetical protein